MPQQSREPDFGVRTATVTGFNPVTKETQEKLDRNAEAEREVDERLLRGKIFSGVPEIQLPAFLLNSTFLLMLTAIASLLALFIYAQSVTVLGQIPLLPKWLQYFSYFFIAGLFAIMVGFGIRLIVIYGRLQTTRRIHFKGLDELNNRSNWRREISRETNGARDHLRKYIASYAIDDKKLASLGFTSGQVDSLRTHKAKMMDPMIDLGAAAWIGDFKNGYQQILDDVAEANIKAHAWRVGQRIAVTPLAIAETLIVLHSNFRLIGDLCSIYNLRLGRFGTLVVIGWAGIQSVLAGRIEDSTKLDSLNTIFGDHAAGALHSLGSHLATATTGILARVAKRSARAVEQGIMQGFLLWRLGKKTQGWLRMVE